MKQAVNSNKLPYVHRVKRHEAYNKPSAEVLAAADKAILIQKLRDTLKHNRFISVGVINSLSDADYEELSGLVDALLAKGLIVYKG